jgi:hypothetical protein
MQPDLDNMRIKHPVLNSIILNDVESAKTAFEASFIFLSFSLFDESVIISMLPSLLKLVV